MVINKDVIQHIRAIESKLLEELQIDINDQSAWHVKLLNVDQCESILSECVLSVYCISIYKKYIYPLYFYLNYSNNYLTIEKIASDLGVTFSHAQLVINNGRDILNTIT